jgi:hypothetical protein
MTVYVVMKSWHDTDTICGIFMSETLAEKHIEQLKIRNKKYIEYYDWWIEKHEIFEE